MKLVTKYTLGLGLAMAVSLSVIAYIRVRYLRADLLADMARDQMVIGHVLRDGVSSIWRDVPDRVQASAETHSLIDRANVEGGASRFEWVDDGGPAWAPDVQGLEGSEFVSRLGVNVGGRAVGSLIVRESLHAVEAAAWTQMVLSVITIVLIVVLGLVASMVLGAWMVGRPVARLVDQARRIGRRELSTEVAVNSRDELGMLATELSAASGALGEALAKRDAESEARIQAVDQLRHSERLSTVGKLAAGIAHELGTPLSVVAGHAQMIAEREVTGDAAVASARAIDHEATRMGKIVRQLLDFARRKGPEGTSCDVNEVARRCVSLLALVAERSDVRCAVEVSAHVGRARIDEDALQQVLTNLLINAIQAMPRGGDLELEISREVARAPDSVTPPVGCVRFDVSDTGAGIAADIRANIFEPFFTTKPPGDGTGLGLAVVHGIVADHGGWIAVDSTDAGTTFSVYLREANA